MSVSFESLISVAASRLSAAGLDICTTLQVGWYNSAVAGEQRLPDFGQSVSLAVLVGNTREIWSPFLAWLTHDLQRLALSNPLEVYVETVVEQAFGELAFPYHIRFSHRPEPHHVAFQQLAEVAGLAWRSPAHLSIHPRYGSWLALRAVVVIALPGPSGEAPGMEPVCADCATGCVPGLNKVLGTNAQAIPGKLDVAACWQDWLAIRDACPVGRQYRYSDDQIRYHYIKDRSFLRSLVNTGSG